MIELFLAQALTPEPLTMAHAKCMVVAARDFERSGESAEAVSTAVVNQCRGLEPRATTTNIMGQLTTDDRTEVLETIRASLRENVVRYVVQYRACEKKRGCNLDEVPIVAPSRALEYLASKAPIVSK
jgi:hypothetical protein